MQSDATGSQQTYCRTLRYAEAIVGGVDELAKRLRVSSTTACGWVAGTSEVPTRVFLSAVDIICAASAEDIRRARHYSEKRIGRGGEI